MAEFQGITPYNVLSNKHLISEAFVKKDSAFTTHDSVPLSDR